MAQQITPDGADQKHTVEIIGTEWVPYDDDIKRGPSKFRQLVVKRDGERVGVPISKAHNETSLYVTPNPDGEDKEEVMRLTRSYDRVYAEELENGDVRFIAERETSHTGRLGRVATEHAEDLDDEGRPMGTFSPRDIQTALPEEDRTAHPDEIDEGTRTKIWERPFDGRIGPKMRLAVQRVASGPYSSMNPLAKSVGPHGSQDYGYQIVHRCLDRRLLKLDPDHESAAPSGRGAVVLTKRGQAFLEHIQD